MKNVSVSIHPLVLDCLTVLRDKETSTALFRLNAEKISRLLITEATYDLSVSKKLIATPVGVTNGFRLSESLVLFTVLRAGLAMLAPSLELFPDTAVGFAGLARDEGTAVAREYYWKQPEIGNDTTILLLDPMLATGGSLLHVLRKLKGANEIRLVTIISAPEGITAIHAEFPEIKIYTGVVDEKLNDKKFIIPGLGDFGDRYFGT